MIPEFYFILKLLVVFILLYGLIVWLSMVFQSVLFQKYRLNKNEAAERKARLHDEKMAKESYKKDLLGEVQEANKD